MISTIDGLPFVIVSSLIVSGLLIIVPYLKRALLQELPNLGGIP